MYLSRPTVQVDPAKAVQANVVKMPFLDFHGDDGFAMSMGGFAVVVAGQFAKLARATQRTAAISIGRAFQAPICITYSYPLLSQP